MQGSEELDSSGRTRSTSPKQPQIPMSYETAVARMFALGHELSQLPSHKFDLAEMRVLLQALHHPEQKFSSVLIAGTNGKGSTAATLAAILRASGLKTALYTSPHLVRINERIRVNGEAIGDQDFARLHSEIDELAERLLKQEVLPWHPSFFEMMTAIALEHFARDKVDIAVLEVGMGGRLDATNVVDPRVSVITDIALDHQKFLGETVGEIAREKAGIIRAGGVVVTLPQQPEANDVIGNAILELNARGVSAVPYVPPVSPASANYATARGNRAALTATDAENLELSTLYVNRYPLSVLGEEILVESPLVGRHQLRNIALAIATAIELRGQKFPGITAHSIEKGIRETHWQARFQVFAPRADYPEMVVDVAHNPAGAWALRSALSELYDGRSLIFVFGAMADKAIAEICEILFPIADRVIVTRPDNPRAASPEEIREAARRTGAEILAIDEVGAALEKARALAKAESVIVITGSIYLAGEAMRILDLRL